MEGERRAEPGERCTCGRRAMTVFVTDAGEVGWCGLSDGGQKGGCVFCGDPAGHQGRRCSSYSLRPTGPVTGGDTVAPGPEAQEPGL
ncbi:MAG: hypothetical protein ACRDZQ_15065 [Acidimicrobiales bacterium]